MNILFYIVTHNYFKKNFFYLIIFFILFYLILDVDFWEIQKCYCSSKKKTSLLTKIVRGEVCWLEFGPTIGMIPNTEEFLINLENTPQKWNLIKFFKNIKENKSIIDGKNPRNPFKHCWMISDYLINGEIIFGYQLTSSQYSDEFKPIKYYNIINDKIIDENTIIENKNQYVSSYFRFININYLKNIGNLNYKIIDYELKNQKEIEKFLYWFEHQKK